MTRFQFIFLVFAILGLCVAGASYGDNPIVQMKLMEGK